MEKHAIKNGKLIKESEALVPITSREVQSNFSVYEALRVLGGRVVHLDDHIARLKSSAAQINLQIPSADFLSWINKLIAEDELSDVTMRILVYGTAEPMIFITWQTLITYPDSYYEEGVAAATYDGERFLPTCKTSNLLLSYLALNYASTQDAFEALLVDREGRALEGTRSNFFALKGDTIYTASDALVLSGVTRKSVIRAAGELGLAVDFTAPLKKDLYSYDAVFISSTSMAAMPLSKIDGQDVPMKNETVLKIRDLVRAWELE